MLSSYEKISISKLLINHEFDFKSKNKIVNMSPQGVTLSIRDLNYFRQISDIDSIKSIYDKNIEVCDTLNIEKIDKVNWELLLGKKYCKTFIKNLLSDIDITSNYITTYHTEILPLRASLYENLSKIIDKNEKEIDIPVYSHASVSGRTTIKKGFNFLTSTKAFRSSCKSLKKENLLVSIDFKACEPNLYLRSIGKEIKNPDVYNYLMNELSINIQDRGKLKRGILSVLYGASDDTAGRILGGEKKTLSAIKDFFMIEKTSEILRKEFDEKGFIYNMYGRPIFSNRSILNKWIQSSAVDFCSLAFLDFVKAHELEVAYLVHDDMVIDCSRAKYEKIKNTKSLVDPVTKISMPVEITALSI